MILASLLGLFGVASLCAGNSPVDLRPLNTIASNSCPQASTGTAVYALNNALTGTTSSSIDLGLFACFSFSVTSTAGAVQVWTGNSSNTYTAGSLYGTVLTGSYSLPKVSRYVWFSAPVLSPNIGGPNYVTPAATRTSIWYYLPTGNSTGGPSGSPSDPVNVTFAAGTLALAANQATANTALATISSTGATAANQGVSWTAANPLTGNQFSYLTWTTRTDTFYISATQTSNATIVSTTQCAAELDLAGGFNTVMASVTNTTTALTFQPQGWDGVQWDNLNLLGTLQTAIPFVGSIGSSTWNTQTFAGEPTFINVAGFKKFRFVCTTVATAGNIILTASNYIPNRTIDLLSFIGTPTDTMANNNNNMRAISVYNYNSIFDGTNWERTYSFPAQSYTAGTNALAATYLSNSKTYAWSITSTTVASSATDIFIFNGSATKTVVITGIYVSGYSTAASAYELFLVKRSTADTGPQAATATAVPMDSADAAATATLHSYTANPTAGTSVGNMADKILSLSVLATNVVTNIVTPFWQPLASEKPIVLHGTAEGVAISGGGTSAASGAKLAITVVGFEY